MPRLAVIDAAAVDGRRRLVLVRRDNVEHLLMIGGPTDIVVEPNIVRATPSRDALPQRPSGTELPPRIAPLPDAAGWPDDAEHVEPQMPEPPPRPARPSFADEVRRPVPPPIAAERERRSDTFAGEPPARPEREPLGRAEREPRLEPMPPRMPRGEPPIPRGEPAMPRGEPVMRASRQTEPPKPPPPRAERTSPPPPPPPAAPLPPSADQNLAEMAQRLEAALRRPAGSADAPPVAPEPPAGRSPRSEPAVPPPGPPPKTSFENLEDEMASLLGRPKSSSS
jgi:hypothetical protein